MAINISNIINISSRKSFKKIWQLLNLRYLYHLLYPFIAEDFRHQLDCSACVQQIKVHTHIANCPQCGAIYTLPPQNPPVVSALLGIAQISIDPLSKLPALLGTLPTIQPFDATSNLNAIKPNIGIELQIMPELDEVMDDASKIKQASKFFSLK